MHFFPAGVWPPAQARPTVLIGPGLRASRGDRTRTPSSDALGNVGIGPLRNAGYNEPIWDPRGFGQFGRAGRDPLPRLRGAATPRR